METIDKSQFIIIGKYYISKSILMSYPCKLSVIDSETKTSKLLNDDKVFELLRNEGLDSEPLHEYFDVINDTTKEERINSAEYIFQEFSNWIIK